MCQGSLRVKNSLVGTIENEKCLYFSIMIYYLMLVAGEPDVNTDKHKHFLLYLQLPLLVFTDKLKGFSMEFGKFELFLIYLIFINLLPFFKQLAY